jgi:hypothetical protein
MSIKYHLPDGSETDMVINSLKVFPVATGEDFRDLFLAIAASPPGAPKPTKLDAFVAAHPSVAAANATVATPDSYADEEYRATGVVLLRLEEDTMRQLELFEDTLKIEKFSRVYQAMDHLREQFGKHTMFLGSSYLAHRFAQHLGARGDAPERTGRLFKGETKRKRLAIPMFMGEVR